MREMEESEHKKQTSEHKACDDGAQQKREVTGSSQWGGVLGKR